MPACGPSIAASPAAAPSIRARRTTARRTTSTTSDTTASGTTGLRCRIGIGSTRGRTPSARGILESSPGDAGSSVCGAASASIRRANRAARGGTQRARSTRIAGGTSATNDPRGIARGTSGPPSPTRSARPQRADASAAAAARPLTAGTAQPASGSSSRPTRRGAAEEGGDDRRAGASTRLRVVPHLGRARVRMLDQGLPHRADPLQVGLGLPASLFAVPDCRCQSDPLAVS